MPYWFGVLSETKVNKEKGRMLRKLIIFLLCRKLGVKRFQPFRFVNQRSKTDYYMFDRYSLLKYVSDEDCFCQSNVKLNWLLDDNCEVKALTEEDEVELDKWLAMRKEEE